MPSPKAFNGLKLGFDKLKNFGTVSLTEDTLTVSAGKKNFVAFTGTDLAVSYDADGNIADVTGGTITSLSIVIHGREVVEVKDLAVAADQLYDLIAAGDTKGAMDLVLAESGVTQGTKFADLITGGTGDDLIFGFGGNDKLDGGDGNDRLDGGKGKDLLTGGLGDDVFVFGRSYGADAIADFGNGLDVIDLTKVAGITDFADLIEHHTHQRGEDVVIKGGHGVQITLKDFDIQNLAETDFLF